LALLRVERARHDGEPGVFTRERDVNGPARDERSRLTRVERVANVHARK